MEDTNLILIAQTLSTQLGRIADSLERIERKLNTEPYHEKVETEHGPTNKYPQETGCYTINKEMTYDEFRRLAQ